MGFERDSDVTSSEKSDHMRQGQNNAKRSRGRSGRRPQHSTNRAYDSNGPDVKIRGNATHVCEKYQQLARDAISAGDRVMAENYFQHAEHYYRLLMAAAPTGQEGQVRPQSNLAYRPPEDEEEETDFTSDNQAQPRHPGQPWHQQGGNGNGQGGEMNGGHRQDDEDEGEDDDRQPNRQPDRQAQPQGEQGDGQPRRRQGRRRRPRGEGQQGEPRRDGVRAEGNGGDDAEPRAEAPATTPEVAPGD